jgi:hypothetical protein
MSAPDLTHAAPRTDEVHLVDLMTSPLCRHRAFERLSNNVIGRTVAQ